MSVRVYVETKASTILRLRKVRVLCSMCPTPVSPWMKGNAGARAAARMVKMHRSLHRGVPQAPQEFSKKSKET